MSDTPRRHVILGDIMQGDTPENNVSSHPVSPLVEQEPELPFEAPKNQNKYPPSDY